MTRQSSSHNCDFAVFEPPRKRGNTQIAIVAKQTVIPARPAVVWHCLQRPYTITTSSSRPAERSIRGVWQVFRISKRIVEQVSDVGQQDIIALLVGVETLHHLDAKISCILRKTKCTRKNLLTISKQWRKVRFYKVIANWSRVSAVSVSKKWNSFTNFKKKHLEYSSSTVWKFEPRTFFHLRCSSR